MSKSIFIVTFREWNDKAMQAIEEIAFVTFSLDEAEKFMIENYDYDILENNWFWCVHLIEINKPLYESNAPYMWYNKFGEIKELIFKY